jgi:threonine/homoserine/homoserine lactone efflux protein
VLAYFSAVVLLLITPGPGVLTTAGVGAAFGRAQGIRYMIGLWIGTNLVTLAVVSGLAGVMLSVPSLRVVLLGLSSLYLFYMASRIALSGSRIAFIESANAPGVWNGILLQIINPKAYVVNTTLFSGFAFNLNSYTTELILKVLIMNAVWVPVHVIWLIAGIYLRKLALTPRTQKYINYAMAAALLAVVALAISGL